MAGLAFPSVGRVRNGTASGRGERVRVAQRVRAILAEVAAAGPDGAPPVGPAHRAAGAESWLPGDDFGTPSWPAPVQPVTGRPSVPLPEAQRPEPPPPELPAVPAGLVERLAARLPVRVDPGRRGAMAVGAAVLVAAVLTGGWMLSSRPHAVAVSTASATTPRPVIPTASETVAPGPSPAVAGTASVSAAAPAVLVVDVAGKVRHPGLYRLPAGSRVDDAVRAAGGALPGVDLTPLNLAAKVTDGQQIAVGRPGAAPAAVGGDASAAPDGPSAPVDLNSATLEQLETLPGVGPVLGQHILDWRAAHGQFTSVDQLRDVSGIGDVKFAAVRSRVTV